MDKTRLAALGVAITAWAYALTAAAQRIYGDESYPIPRENDWMTSGLTPLVTLVGLGIVVAAVAALIVVMVQRLPERRRRGT